MATDARKNIAYELLVHSFLKRLIQGDS